MIKVLGLDPSTFDVDPVFTLFALAIVALVCAVMDAAAARRHQRRIARTCERTYARYADHHDPDALCNEREMRRPA